MVVHLSSEKMFRLGVEDLHVFAFKESYSLRDDTDGSLDPNITLPHNRKPLS